MPILHFEEIKMFVLFTVKLQNYCEIGRVGLIQKFVIYNLLHTRWKTGFEVSKEF